MTGADLTPAHAWPGELFSSRGPLTGMCHSLGAVVKIPEDLRIPALVFTLEAIMLAGFALIFFMLVPR